MLLRGLLAAAILSAGVLLSASFVLETPQIAAIGESDEGTPTTLAMAPISLGNPAAAANLQILRPASAVDSPITLVSAPLFQQTVKASRGDTLSGMLIKAGISRRDSGAAITALRKHFNPGRLRQGQAITINFQADDTSMDDTTAALSGRFVSFSLLPDQTRRIVVSRTENGTFQADIEKRQLTRRLSRADNTIKYSLSQAGTNVGVPNIVLAEIIRLYSWDVDFQRDIRKGDEFEVMYERFYDATGELAHNGEILYASLTLSGKRYAVYRHQLKNGETDYFDEKGQSARKALMRTPIDGARLSSGFGKRRHPILGYNKIHKGLDFAAPRGTPIYAAGNGTVEHAGRKGAYGKYVRIRHNSEYSSAYAHMSRLNTKKGRRVKQGQIIGYVGTTGRSTGPHLHYEILRGNTQVNPMRVKMPSGRKLNGQELTAFQAARVEIEKQYAEIDLKIELASGD